MSPSAAPTVSHVDIQRSRQLVHDSRGLIASAKELIAQSRRSIARQRYLTIVCAWCQQTIRWQRTERGLRRDRSAIVFALTVLRPCLGNWPLAPPRPCSLAGGMVSLRP